MIQYFLIHILFTLNAKLLLLIMISESIFLKKSNFTLIF